MWRRSRWSSTTLDDPRQSSRNSDAAFSWYMLSPPAFLSSASSANEIVGAAIRELRNLRGDWDGFGALPIGSRALDDALDLATSTAMITGEIGPPDVSPNANGTVSFEWETPRGEAYAEIGDAEASAFVRGHRSPTFYVRGASAELAVTLPALLKAILSEQQHTAVGSSTQLQNMEGLDDLAATGR